LIYKILKNSGLKAKLVGNIGKPVLQILQKSKKEDIFIFELSSFQLENLKKSPHIAVFLNLYPAHLDYHKNFRNYQKAKENITLHQSEKDFFIYNTESSHLEKIAKKTKALRIGLKIHPKKIRVKNFKEASLKGNWLLWGKEKIISKKDIPLKGEFNILNILAAIAVGKILGIPNNKIKKAIKSYKSLPHRLEFIGKYKGIEFYNDSLATIPEAVIAALGALGTKVETLILGGVNVKGFDFSRLAKEIVSKKINTLVFLNKSSDNKNETGKRIWNEVKKIKKQKLPKSFFVSSMREAVKIAYQETKKGGICLLSPGAPSFNLFKNYKERGKLFKKFVKLYGKKT